MYDKAVQVCPHDWRMYYIRFYYGLASCSRTNGGEDITLETWEELLLEVAKPSGAYLKPWAGDLVSKGVLPCFITLAFPKDAEATTPVKEYCDKIEAFYRDFSTLTNQQPNICILYVWYFTLCDDTLRAKRLTKEIVVQCLEMLSGDELENDAWSSWDLGRVFSGLEDFPNALVAWEMKARSLQAVYDQWLKRKEEYEVKLAAGKRANSPIKADEVKTEDDNENDNDSDKQDKGTREATRLDSNLVDAEPDGLTCLDACGSIQLDEDCYQKLQEGTLHKQVCDKSHHHYHVKKRDEKRLAEVPDGSVLRGDQTMTLEAWKREIKADYVDIVNSAV
ncbi:hypothetical protein SLS62_006043 [Diatrype stigma]|uniref:Uncharacterized protein n=1 Tax=Diatrype stigma TaxID=117547 RepID=A0AAN9URL1_9PEZI